MASASRENAPGGENPYAHGDEKHPVVLESYGRCRRSLLQYTNYWYACATLVSPSRHVHSIPRSAGPVQHTTVLRPPRPQAWPAVVGTVDRAAGLTIIGTSDSGPFSCFVRRPRSARSASRRPQPRHHVEDPQDLRPVAYHLTIAHLTPAQRAVAVHHEGGAPGHVAVLVEDTVGADDGAVDVAQEREWESLGLGVGGVREGTVGADGEDRGAALPDLWVDLDQAGELRRSNAAPVEAVEDEHHVLPSERRQRDVSPRGGRQGEVRRGLTKA
jgi:hypothetical protein